jgi:hypothetical protein
MGSEARLLPQNITSHDLLKSFAVIMMIIDHIGYYFFPEELWWRAIGRLSFPVWLFLVGYSSSRDLPLKLWGGAFLIVILDALCNIPILPFNILVTIILIRILIDPVMVFALQSKINFWIMSVILFMWIIPTMYFVEYGALGLLTAMFGYLVRHRQELKDRFGNDKLVFEFMLFACLSYIFAMQINFIFSIPEFIFITIGVFCVKLHLYAKFESEDYPKLTKKIPAGLTWALQFMGRRTLEIYVVHLIVLQIIAVYVLQVQHL